MASLKKKRKLKNSWCVGSMLKEKHEKGPQRVAFFTPAMRRVNNKNPNMSKIHVGIAPKDLLNTDLIGEYRIIRQIPTMIRNGNTSKKEAPKNFNLNKNDHVRFFYDKLEYLRKRFDEICTELKKRNIKIKITIPPDLWNFGAERMKDYVPSEAEIRMVRSYTNKVH